MYIEFKTIEKSNDSRKYKVCFHHSEIKKIKTIFGGENVYLEVNNIPVEGSYQYLIKLLTTGLTSAEKEDAFGRDFTIYEEW